MMPLFNGGAPPEKGEKIENVLLYKNGGVGALNDMGTQEAAVRAERWAWVVVTRKPGEMTTYVNGRACASVKLETPKQAKQKKASEEEGAEAGQKKAALREKFVLDPAYLALFPTVEVEDEGKEVPLRGLSLKYVRVAAEHWKASQVAEELFKLRSADEEADMREEAEETRQKQLSLQSLYAKPPPVWLHPAFAAEFADPFIAGTPFESGAMHVSLEVLTLTLDTMLKEGGTGADLPHGVRSALNTACAQLKDTRKLAHKLVHGKGGEGQERAFFRAVGQAIEDLEPGEVVLLPWDGQGPLLFVVRRGAQPDHDTCTFTVVNPTGSEYHQGTPTEGQKLKFRTCLELGNVPLAKLNDEAWWVTAWYAMTISPDAVAKGTVKRGPLKMLYDVLLPTLADDSLDRAVAKWDAACAERGAEPPPARTLRRSDSGHYGCVRHALRYLLQRSGASDAECRQVSLLLRLQMFRLAQNDLGFVQTVSGDERTVLQLACRQLAYKAAKLGSGEAIALERMVGVRSEIEALQRTLAGTPGAGLNDTAPPPLVLCAADAHLARPTLLTLLGDALLRPEGGVMEPADALKDVEVLALYFSASWCPPCVATTPLLASAYKQLRARGKGLQLVLVPQDRTEDEFDEYRAKMPWPALPFGGLLPALLAHVYRVQSIPSLVLLDSTGRLISTDGVRLMRKHARAFPCAHRT
jgi:nucleoredoxin